MKRVFLQGAMMVGISGLLVFIGYSFRIKLLMLSYSEETSSGITVGGSILPIVIAAICCYLFDRIYYRTNVV
ncbi:hypothetical protein [Pontibacillus salipaludis]|uniref:Uncharacterized protein n=1 Tax=Pontibacillus salipaludis TaxID=1697394 RepID=A0ABQ1Q5S8_9BACI|nr:hypothetical protein [Pontibacillus salipaludis]GGD13348.1 hypothetical protein GCM10011389_21220 [Pontibacillus salipaludis]